MQRVEPAQPHDYYQIPVRKSAMMRLPPAYLEGFLDKVYVITPADLKQPVNPYLAGLASENWLFQSPEPNPDYESFVADMKRPLSIKVEVAGAHGAIYKTIYDAEQFFQNRENARDQLTGKHFIEAVYYGARLFDYAESHQLTFEAFEKIAGAYLQKCIYIINSTIQGALSDNDYTVMDASAKSDLVFLLDGRVYLDLYHISASVVCPRIMGNDGLLKVPSPTQIMARIPYLPEHEKFGMPVILCNEHMLPFVYSNKSVLLETSPDNLGEEQAAALKDAIELDLQQKSEGASKVKRQPTKGKHATKIILAATGIAGGIAVGVIFAIPGGIPLLLASLGFFAAGSAVPAGATAATVFAVAAVAGAAGAGATSGIYFTARAAIPRTLEYLSLESCRISENDFLMVEFNRDPAPALPRLFQRSNSISIVANADAIDEAVERRNSI